ncbi:MAG: hypothetical protein AAFX99_17840 [Myxococcota bacterium]
MRTRMCDDIRRALDLIDGLNMHVPSFHLERLMVLRALLLQLMGDYQEHFPDTVGWVMARGRKLIVDPPPLPPGGVFTINMYRHWDEAELPKLLQELVASGGRSSFTGNAFEIPKLDGVATIKGHVRGVLARLALCSKQVGVQIHILFGVVYELQLRTQLPDKTSRRLGRIIEIRPTLYRNEETLTKLRAHVQTFT